MFSGLELDISTAQTKPDGNVSSSLKKFSHFINNNSRKMGTLLNAPEGVAQWEKFGFFSFL